MQVAVGERSTIGGHRLRRSPMDTQELGIENTLYGMKLRGEVAELSGREQLHFGSFNCLLQGVNGKKYLERRATAAFARGGAESNRPLVTQHQCFGDP